MVAPCEGCNSPGLPSGDKVRESGDSSAHGRGGVGGAGEIALRLLKKAEQSQGMRQNRGIGWM